jgi:hypothetical protein
MAKSLISAIARAIFLVIAVGPIAANNEANALLHKTAFNHGCRDATSWELLSHVSNYKNIYNNNSIFV